MKTLYLDCSMGAAGDMLTAALLELLPDPDGFVDRLNALGIPGVRYAAARTIKGGVTGTQMTVTVHGAEEDDHDHEHEHHHDHGHEHHHHHSGMGDVERLVRDRLALPETVKADVLAVYGLIAQAESQVHGVPVTEVHFHEVGALDAVADVAAVCLLLRELAPDQIVASPVQVGGGQVRCAHGILPVPAPATALLLRDVPICGGAAEGELCTPTGAALLKRFATRFGPLPPMRVKAVGYGMGKRDFPPAVNCLRAMLGETEDGTDAVLELSCNVDDMTAEELGFAMERLFDAGAKEVYTVPIGMKKSRPGTLLRVLCSGQDRERMLRVLFRHTTTIGVRETQARRYVLDRRTETLDSPWGPVGRKISAGWGVSRSKYEYEDLARIAREQDMSLEEVRRALEDRS